MCLENKNLWFETNAEGNRLSMWNILKDATPWMMAGCHHGGIPSRTVQTACWKALRGSDDQQSQALPSESRPRLERTSPQILFGTLIASTISQWPLRSAHEIRSRRGARLPCSARYVTERADVLCQLQEAHGSPSRSQARVTRAIKKLFFLLSLIKRQSYSTYTIN